MQPGFFDQADRLENLEKLGNPLPRPDSIVDWQAVRPLLKMIHQKQRKSNAGCKPPDVRLMCKMLVLQTLYNLSDDQTAFQMRDRLPLRRVLGLLPRDTALDARALWPFREQLADHRLIDKPFRRSDAQLWQSGPKPKGGQIVDASLAVDVPKDCNSRDENQQVKAGETPEGWHGQPNMKRRKDEDARRTKKDGKHHYGYKNHINVDKEQKLIRRHAVTDASVHDSQVFDDLLDEENSGLSVCSGVGSERHESCRCMERSTSINVRASFALVGLMVSSCAVLSVAASPSDADAQLPTRKWSSAEESVVRKDGLFARSTEAPASQTPSSTVLPPTQPDITPSFLPAAVIQWCEQQIESRAVRELRSRATELLKRKAVPNADAWSSAVAKALCANSMPLTPQYFSLIFTFIEKESSFIAHGLLPEQPDAFRKIAYRIIDDVFRSDPRIIKRLVGKGRAAEYVPMILDLLQKIRIADSMVAKTKFDRYYKDYNWKRIKTEWDIENQLVDDVYTIANSNTTVGFLLQALLKLKPEINERLRQRLLFRTIGPMQVSISYAQKLEEKNGRTYTDSEMRDVLYTIPGGVHFGTHRLQDLVDIYASRSELDATAVGFIAVDYTGGKRLARNQALVDQTSRVTGVEFPKHATLSWSQVETQLRVLARKMLASNEASQMETTVPSVMHEFKRSLPGRKIEQNALYLYIKEQYRTQFNEEPAFAAVPKICLRPYKGGYYCLSDIAQNVIKKFKANCEALACRWSSDGKISSIQNASR